MKFCEQFLLGSKVVMTLKEQKEHTAAVTKGPRYGGERPGWGSRQDLDHGVSELAHKSFRI